MGRCATLNIPGNPACHGCSADQGPRCSPHASLMPSAASSRACPAILQLASRRSSSAIRRTPVMPFLHKTAQKLSRRGNSPSRPSSYARTHLRISWSPDTEAPKAALQVEALVEMDAEFSGPAWMFGGRTYQALSDGGFLAIYNDPKARMPCQCTCGSCENRHQGCCGT